jgi:4-amino-4-deoxy-L-arabinose transferase-like glycosyltransferase
MTIHLPSRKKLKVFSILLLIAILSFVMHFRVFKLDLISMHVWRQTETQSVIQNFVREDMNILNPRFNCRGDGDGIFRKEFPLMQWIIAVADTAFGESIVLTRAMMFLFCILTMLGFYQIGRIFFYNPRSETEKVNSDQKLIFDLLLFAPPFLLVFSPTFFFFCVNPIPDIFALMCMAWGLFYFFRWYRYRRKVDFLTTIFFLMISSLVKLPFVLFYALFLIPFFQDLFSREGIKKILGWTPVLLSVLPILFWYISAIPGWNGNGIVQGISAVKGDQAWKEYFHFLQHNIVSTIPELIIGYAVFPLFLAGIIFAFRNRVFKNPEFRILLIPFFLFVLYFLFELNMIGEAHDYYLFPFYPFVVLLITYGLREILKLKFKQKSLALIFILLLPFTTQIRMKDRWNIEKPGFNKDLLTWRDELRQAVPSDSLCIAGNDISPFIMLYYIDKKGWTYDYYSLTPERLSNLIDRGARYLYSDQREVDEKADIGKFIEKQVAEFGSVKVFKLKLPVTESR